MGDGPRRSHGCRSGCALCVAAIAMHAKAAIMGLRTGKHVMRERPMAINLAEAMRMLGEGRASKRMLAVSYYRRLYPNLIRAKRLIVDGTIGQPLLAEAKCQTWLKTLQDREWLTDPQMVGWTLFETGSHRIDAVNFPFGEPQHACGIRSNAIQVEDSATVLMQYAGDAHGVVDVRWNLYLVRNCFRIIGSSDCARSIEWAVNAYRSPERAYG